MSNKVNDKIQQYIAAGGNPNSKHFKNKLKQAKTEGEAEYQQQKERETRERGNVANKVATVAKAGIAIIAVTFVLLLIFAGIALATVTFLLAEYAAIRDGIETLTTQNAGLYAFTITFGYLTLLFIREVLEYSGSEREDIPRFSFRLLWYRLKYMLGFGGDWKAQRKQETSTLRRLDSVIRWGLWTIVGFGVLGRAGELMMQYDSVAWYNGVQLIITEASLIEFVGILFVPVQTVFLLLAVDYIVSYMYSQFALATGGITVNPTLDSIAISRQQAIEQKQLEMIQREIELKKHRN